jgi:hypothetical protein
MSAGSESSIDTRGYNGANYVGNIVEKVLLARQLAENERKYASKKAEEAGTSLEEAGIEKGHFFKKALAGEFGGNYIDRKKGQLQNVVKKYKIAKRLTKNPKATFKFIKPLLKKKVGSAQTKMFRAKFDYMYSDDINRPIPQSPKVGNSAKKIQKATAARSKRVTKEELLSSLTGIVDSLNKTAESIGKTTAGISSGVISAAKAQVDLVEQLKLKNTTLEDKLDKIALAIANQTQFQKRSVAKANTKQAEDKLEAIKDSASTEVPDDTQTAVNETQLSQLSQNITPTTNIINNPSIERPMGGYPSLSEMGKAGMHIPEAETGGIVSGPDSGYLAKLHGNEMVVPINNNYTQGEPSAMDGKVRPKPSSSSRSSKGVKTSGLPSFERGTTGSSVGGRFGFGITNMRGIASGGSTQSSAMAQPLVDAMSLPMMAAGGSILATVSKLMTSMGSEGTSIAPEIERISRPIADVFGLPPSIVKKTKQGMGSKTNAGSFGEEDDGESKKNIFTKLMDGFGALMEKLKDGVNNKPTPPPGNGNPQATDITGNEKELLKRLMVAEAGGEGVEGMAMVGRSVINRAGLIQSGEVGAGTFNASSGSVTDVIQAPNQYQPYAQGKLNTPLNADQNSKAEEAYQLIMNDPEYRKRIKSTFNLTDQQVNHGAAATGFRNYNAGAGVDTSQQKNEFNAGNHTFNTAGNLKLKTAYNSATVKTPSTNPSSTAQQPQNPSPTGQLGQAITNNYGMKVDEERTFTHPTYGELKARKTTKGFDFYRGRTILDVSPSSPQGKSIVDYFTSTNGGISTSTMGPQASISPPPESNKNAQTQTIAQKIDDKGNANIIAMMMPPGQKQQMASTSQPSSAENSAASPGYNALTQSGLYNPLYG